MEARDMSTVSTNHRATDPAKMPRKEGFFTGHSAADSSFEQPGRGDTLQHKRES
jgi:hypothetical protein